jgi:hypothetical protein
MNEEKLTAMSSEGHILRRPKGVWESGVCRLLSGKCTICLFIAFASCIFTITLCGYCRSEISGIEVYRKESAYQKMRLTWHDHPPHLPRSSPPKYPLGKSPARPDRHRQQPKPRSRISNSMHSPIVQPHITRNGVLG